VRRIEEMRKRLLEESRGAAHKSTVSINDLVRRVAERATVVKSFGIAVSIQELEKDVYTQIDATEVLRAFDKLLENATDAIRAGDDRSLDSPEVWVVATCENDQGVRIPKAKILFVDNGPGFTPEQRREFEENKDIKSTKHDGLGRGLALAHRCLADNGIYLRIVEPPASLTARGAAFELTLPLHVPRQLRALIIDDQDTWLSMVMSKVASDTSIEIDTTTSYERVLEAANGIAAAQTAISEYDLILMDCHFSRLPYEGPELLELLQARCPDLARRVVLMSGKDDFLNRRDVSVLNKFSDVLHKLPHVLHELRTRRG